MNMITYRSVGYHGTTRKSADYIVLKNKFPMSCDDEEWLGTGVYFFENDSKQAIYWCTKARHYNEWAVIKSEIEADLLIDLVDLETYERYSESVRKLQSKFLSRKDRTPRKILNAVVLNALHELMKYDVVRGIFEIPYIKNEKRTNIVPMQIQLCVKHHNCIKSIEEVDVV